MFSSRFPWIRMSARAVVAVASLGALLPAQAYLEIPGHDPKRPVRLLQSEEAPPKRLHLAELWRPPANTAPDSFSAPRAFSESLDSVGDLFGSLFDSFQLNLPIPDNSTVGESSQKTIQGFSGLITSVQVQLQIAARGDQPMFNGDFHVTLSHGSESAVLLNRTGRRESSSVGYGDSGFSITLSDSAPADVHNYRITVTGSHTTPLSLTDTPAALIGIWQPDGRSADPSLVLPSSPRDATLARFIGLDPNGTWTLHVSDLSANGLGQLVDWSLQIATVPELSPSCLFLSTGLIAFAYLRRRRFP